MTQPMHGLSGGGSNGTRRQVQRNSSNSPSGSNTSPYRQLPRRHPHPSPCCSPGSQTIRCSVMACRPNGSTRSAKPTRTAYSTSPNACRKKLPKPCWNWRPGPTPEIPQRTPIEADPFAHPDAQRRFRVLTNLEELERALDYPWDKWAVFLHPAQRRLVERDYNGPARISGSAGTGKTIVALHRAVAVARRHPQARVLLTTFSKALANALRIRLRTLTDNEPDIADRIAVHPVTGIGYELYTSGIRSAQHRAAHVDRDTVAPSCDGGSGAPVLTTVSRSASGARS